ncbi:MAG: hypothetical protein AAFR35_12615 [Pseudomonadota bacterium]
MRKARYSIVLAAAIFAPTFIQAQANQCGERETVTKRLTSGYGETFNGGGLRSADAIFEVWTSETDGTWTILMTRPDGTSCIMASGTNWREASPADKVLGVPG